MSTSVYRLGGMEVSATQIQMPANRRLTYPPALQFHLSVGNDSTTPKPRTPSGLRYEEAEFAYEPLFDEKNDKALLDLLPDYLTEEICFPRNHAQRFYSKVVDSMTKKIVVEDD